MYCFAEKSTRHAISRSSYKVIQEGDIVQLNLSAKICGYSPSIGLPVCCGKLSPEKRDLVQFGLDAHYWTEEHLKPGILASQVAKDFIKFYEDHGRRANYFYGPCHGTGLIEVEAPWMETISDYELMPNMTFQIDTFVTSPTFGLRWEKPIAITADGGVTFRGRFVEPEDLPGLLRDTGFTRTDTINVHYPDGQGDMRMPSRVMTVLLRKGFPRTILVGDRRSYSHIGREDKKPTQRRQLEPRRVGADLRVRYK
jgi:hypothetical protein